MITQKMQVERRKNLRFKVKKQLAERRQYRRFKVKETTYILFMPYSIRMGQIIDINECGIAFHYINIGTGSQEFLNASEALVFLGEDILCFSVPIKTITHFEVLNQFSQNTVKMYRAFAKFARMKEDQKSQLFHFLKNFTDGPLEDRRGRKCRI